MIGRAVSFALCALRFHATRSALTAVALALATAMVASTLGFQRGYEESLRRNIDAMGYQVLVTGKGCPHEAATLILRGGSIPMYIQEDMARHIVSQPEVEDATRFFMQSVPRDDGKSYQLHVGIDEKFLELKPGVEFQRGGWFSSPDANEAILGYNVAEYLRLELGDDVRVQGRTLRVQGVLDRLGTQDDGTIFLPLEVAQTVFERRDRLTGIGLRLHDIGSAAGLIDRLYEVPSVQVVRMAQVQGTILGILTGVESLLIAFGGLCLLVALMSVVNVGLIAAHERRAEMGVLRAIGCPTGKLFALVWCESLLLALGGAAAGIALAVVARGAIEQFARDTLTFVPAGRVIALHGSILLTSAAVVVGLAMLAGAYPALRSSRVSPAESIRGRGA